MGGARQITKKVLSWFPAALEFAQRLQAAIRHRREASNFRGRDPEELFTMIHRSHYWGGESRSGPGSDLAQAAIVCRELPRLLKSLRVAGILDIPCGDFNWMRTIKLEGVVFVGADIVKVVVEENQRRFSNSQRQFVVRNLIEDSLPAAELILVRDCLVHFSFLDIHRALANICRTEARYLLTTSYPRQTSNWDIETGQWRPLNLELPPFNLPSPLAAIEELAPDPGWTDKSLLLWTVNSIRNHLRLLSGLNY